jgi:hypothetical protein
MKTTSWIFRISLSLLMLGSTAVMAHDYGNKLARQWQQAPNPVSGPLSSNPQWVETAPRQRIELSEALTTVPADTTALTAAVATLNNNASCVANSASGTAASTVPAGTISVCYTLKQDMATATSTCTTTGTGRSRRTNCTFVTPVFLEKITATAKSVGQVTSTSNSNSPFFR